MNEKDKKDTDHLLSKHPPEKDVNIRCPRLGHQIDFSYCQRENNGLPCFKTLDCWHNHFNVHAYLKDRLTKEDFEKVFINQGKPKLFSLLDLIEQAKKQKDTKKNNDKGKLD